MNVTNSAITAQTFAPSQEQELKTPEQDPILGLVAGEGKLPAILARSAKERGFQVVALCLSEDARNRVLPHCQKAYTIAPGQIGRSIEILRKEQVKQMVFIGKIPKAQLLLNMHKLDWIAVRELSKLSNFSDDTIQCAMGDLCQSQGIKVRPQAEFLRELFPDVGVITSRQPTAQEYADIAYGKRIAKEIARLDIGQTVVVREEMILAIEAIEGTDEAIRRAVELARHPVVVVKVSKANHDQRFDIPTVGLSTLASMTGPKPGGVLAIEANKTMMVEEKEMISYAERHGMTIVAV